MNSHRSAAQLGGGVRPDQALPEVTTAEQADAPAVRATLAQAAASDRPSADVSRHRHETGAADRSLLQCNQLKRKHPVAAVATALMQPPLPPH